MGGFPLAIVQDVESEGVVRFLGRIKEAGVTDDVVADGLDVGHVPFPYDLISLIDGGEMDTECRAGRRDEGEERMGKSSLAYVRGGEGKGELAHGVRGDSLAGREVYLVRIA